MALIPGQYQPQYLPSIRHVLGEFFTTQYQYPNQSKYQVPKLKIPRSRVTKKVASVFDKRQQRERYICKWDHNSGDSQKCLATFDQSSLLVSHIVNKHTLASNIDIDSKKWFMCKWQNCFKKFNRRNCFVMHSKSHIRICNKTCEICGKTYSSKQYLRKHKNVIHNVH
jgi:hypothetical protein